MHSYFRKIEIRKHTSNIIYSCMMIIFTRIIISDIIGTWNQDHIFQMKTEPVKNQNILFFYAFFNQYMYVSNLISTSHFNPFYFFEFLQCFSISSLNCQIYLKIIIISANNSANHLSPTFSARPNLVSKLLWCQHPVHSF